MVDLDHGLDETPAYEVDIRYLGEEKRRVDIGAGMALIWEVDDRGRPEPRWEHLCTVQRDPLPAPPTPALAAPWLSPGHRIVVEEPLTIDGSLLCGSCNAHGFVRDGTWQAC